MRSKIIAALIVFSVCCVYSVNLNAQPKVDPDVSKALAEEEAKMKQMAGAPPAQTQLAPGVDTTTPSAGRAEEPPQKGSHGSGEAPGDAKSAQTTAPAPSTPVALPQAEPSVSRGEQPDAPAGVVGATGQPTGVVPAEVSAVSMPVVQLNAFLEPYVYNSDNRRDPFLKYIPPLLLSRKADTPRTPLEDFDLNDLQLTMILWNVHKPKAVIRDSTGVTHFVTTKQRIGKNNGYIAAIREGEIVIVEPWIDDDRKVFSTKLMKIAPN